MNNESDPSEFKVGELVRKIGEEQVGEVVSVGEDGLFVRYKNDSSSVTFFPVDLVERVKSGNEQL
jgi:hypothetical protein